MPTIELATFVAAPIERVFDLARSIDLHTNSTSSTGERAIVGVTSGLIGPGQEVTWRARHFGVWQSLTVCVTVFEPEIFSLVDRSALSGECKQVYKECVRDAIRALSYSYAESHTGPGNQTPDPDDAGNGRVMHRSPS